MEKAAQGSPNSILQSASRNDLGTCRFRELQSVQENLSMSCHETQIPHKNTTHQSHVHTQHSQDRGHSSQLALDPGGPCHVSKQVQVRLEAEAGGGRPGGSQGCHSPVYEDDLGRSSTGTQGQEPGGHLGVRAQGSVLLAAKSLMDFMKEKGMVSTPTQSLLCF